jgi:hypothetical protein
MRPDLVLDALRIASANELSAPTPMTNAMTKSFGDTFKTELIADRIWRSRSHLELGHRLLRRLVQQRPPARITRRCLTC